MQNAILVLHLILALCLIGVVLLQRSEGGGLGMGGGGGGGAGGGIMSGRAAATALGKLTWVFAIAFLCTSISLTLITASNNANSSVVDGADVEEAPATAPLVPAGESLLPPSNDPLVPQSAD